MRKAILAGALMTMVATAPAAAQGGWAVGINGGVAVPMGDLADGYEMGFGGGIQIGMRDPAAKVGWGIEAQFYRFALSEIGGIDIDGSLNAYGAMARLDFTAGGNFYLLGGAGLFRQEFTFGDDAPDFEETTNTDFALQAGAGMNFGTGFFVEAKFVNIFAEESVQMIPITVGIRF
jgi:opacity protein-like surface antigen